ncbi:MAG: DEAD/DEAH box helicase family protein [Rikenellaceae bacterium]
MNKIAENIKQRMSLREPLQEALDILVEVTDKISLTKPPVDELSEFLKEELVKVHDIAPTCSNFERDFPSIAFSIATGVGKTRLMGASVAYLNLKYGIHNFFVLAPNLTIYNKLKDDFGNPAYHKYLFKGFSEFVNTEIKVVSGEDYGQSRNLFAEQIVYIHLFNVAKFNSETRGTKKGGQAIAPRIKRMSEYIGQSYWQHLADLEDLVILMDESHRYHADSSKKSINELRPILGIEMSATPIDEKGKPFKNVVYEYSLARAIDDGKYIKTPAVGTNSAFDKTALSDKEIEEVKLVDAISVHENTKTNLEVYARTTGQKMVKPFILVVCRDINHAKETVEYLESDNFFEGTYRGKVLRIDSTNKAEEVEQQFISLESYDNAIEIVVHVNMLKEGWDVTNLYTIVPLRAANASVLIEQTIGRGLRLPYDGKRTGVEAVDTLTVLAHENFDKIIVEAKDPNSILNKLNYIDIQNIEGISKPTEAITVKTKAEAELEKEVEEIKKIEVPERRQEAENVVEAKRAVQKVLSNVSNIRGITKVEDILTKPEIKAQVIAQVAKVVDIDNALNLFKEEIKESIEEVLVKTVTVKQLTEIEIPRITIYRSEANAYFKDFELDTSCFDNIKVINPEIYIQHLDSDQTTIIRSKVNVKKSNPIRSILVALIDFPEVDMDESAPLCYKLVEQAIDKIKSTLTDEEEIYRTVETYKGYISQMIYNQMMKHFVLEQGDLLSTKVLPFTRIEPWNGTKLKGDGIRDYRDVPKVSPLSYVYEGYEKAGHECYKFDSGTEIDFTNVLENDSSVLKWLHPADKQFNILWGIGNHHYRPDFIVETANEILMVETKKRKDIETEEVVLKKVAAIQYCERATEYTTANGGKPWRYVLIPHDYVVRTHKLEYILSKC